MNKINYIILTLRKVLLSRTRIPRRAIMLATVARVNVTIIVKVAIVTVAKVTK